jgi:TetR/AcrR family transcriptional repressor of nem operon
LCVLPENLFPKKQGLNMPRKTDKREKLIGAAGRLNHEQGFRSTTLADIAQQASVPLGNVYYYFKTKDSIGGAVIELLSNNYADFFKKINAKISEPAARLRMYLESNSKDPESIARYGCQVGGLCQELGKEGGVLADQAAKLLHDIIQWVEQQFRALGLGERSPSYAQQLVASIQGINLLTLTFKDPKIINEQSQVILSWLESVIGAKIPAVNLSDESIVELEAVY